MTPTPHKLLSTKEASARSGYHTDYLARLAKSEKIIATRVGRSWLIDEESLSKFIESQQERKKELSQILSRERVGEYRGTQSGGALPIEDSNSKASSISTGPKIWKPEPLATFRSHAFAILVALMVTAAGLYFAGAHVFEKQAQNTLESVFASAENVHGSLGNFSAALGTSFTSTGEATHLAETIPQQNHAALTPLTLPKIVSFKEGSDVAVTQSTLADAQNKISTPDSFSIASSGKMLARFATHPELFGTLYLEGISNAGSSLTSFAVLVRDGSVQIPRGVLTQGTSLAEFTQHLSNSILTAYQDGMYAWVDATPDVPRTTALTLLSVGSTLHSAFLNAPSELTQAYEKAVTGFVASSLDIEGVVEEHELTLGTGVASNSSAALTSGSVFLGDVIQQGPQVALTAPRAAGTLDAFLPQASLNLVTSIPQNIGSFFGNSWASIASLFTGKTDVFAWLGHTGLPFLHDNGEKVAVFTYETINDFFRSAYDGYRALASLFGPQNIAIIPAAFFPGEQSSATATTTITTTATSTTQTIIGPASAVIQHVENYFTVGGVTNAYLEQRLAEVTRAIVIQILDRRGGQNGGGPVDLTHIDGSTITNSTFSGSNVNTTNLTAGNATTTNFVTTNASTTNLYANSAFIGNLTIATGTASTSNLIATNSTTTNATATNFYATNGTIDTFFSTLANITGLLATNSTTTNATSTNLFSTNASLTNLFANLATVGDIIATNATTTNLIATNATSTNLFSTNGTISNFFSTLATVTGLNVTNSTTTNATSTNFFATNGTISNFFSTLATITGLTTTNATTTNLTVSSLTQGRVPFIGVGGLLQDSANLLFDGTTLTANALNLTNPLTVANGGTGAITLTGLLKGNGTSPFTTAVADTDYQAPIALTTTGTGGMATFIGDILNIPQYSSVSTSTSNTWGGTQTFTNPPVLGTLTGLIAGNNGVLSALATTTVSCTGGASCSTFTVIGNTPVVINAATSTTGVLGIGPAGQIQNGPTITLATSTTAFNGLTSALTITGSTNVITFAPSLSGTLDNAGLTNSTVSYGGVTLSLGQSDATPAFDLTDAFNLPINGGTTGTLGIARGGTNAISQVTNGVNYFNGTSITSGSTFTFDGTQLTVPNFFATNATTTNATSTNFFATNGTITNLTTNLINVANLIVGNSTTTNATTTNSFATNSITTNATSTNFFATNGSIANFFSTIANITNLLTTNATTTNETISSLTNGRVTYAGIGGLLQDSANLLFNGTTLTANTLNLANALGAIYGGTGQSAVTTGDLLFGSATNTWNRLADVATGNVLLSGGVGVAPSWGKVSLTTAISGVLPIANGGTATSTQTTNGVNYFDGTQITSGLGLTFDGTNLGVGSSTPFAKLSVKGSGTTTGTNFQTTNSSNTALFTVLDNGNVGISSSTPGTRLDVVKNDNGTDPIARFFANNLTQGVSVGYNNIAVLGTNANIAYSLLAKGTGGNIWLGQDTPGTGIRFNPSDGSGNTIYFGNRTVGLSADTGNKISINQTSNPAIGLTVDTTTGNVGIGTTTPGSPLVVAKSQNNNTFAQVANFTSGTAAQSSFNLVNAANTAAFGLTSAGFTTSGSIVANMAYFYSDSANGINFIPNNASAPVVFSSGGVTERMRIAANGNVGIGSSTPSAKLVVVGQTIAQYFTATSTTQASTFPLASTTALTNSTALYNSYLTANRIPYTSNASGLLSDSSNLTFDGNNLFDSGVIQNNNITLTNATEGDLEVDGTSAGVSSPHIDFADTAGTDYTWRLEQNTPGNIFSIYSSANTSILTLAKTSGNVGIGDNSPAAMLTVGNGDLFQVNSSGAIAAATGISSSGTINFSGLTASKVVFTDASKNLTSTGTVGIAQGGTGTGTQTTNGVNYYDGTKITSDSGFVYTAGNVGIGTTTISDLNGPNKVSIQGTAGTEVLNIGDGFNSLGFYINHNVANGAQIGTISNTPLAFFTNNSIARMLIDTSGNVGIGNTAPQAKLQVTDSSRPYTDALSGGSLFRLTTGTGANTDESLMFGIHDTDYSWIQASKPGSANRNLALNPNGGNVGIGTTTPASTLTVVGVIRSAANFADVELVANNGGGFRWALDGSNNLLLQQTSNTFGSVTTPIAVLTSGNVGIGTASPLSKLTLSGQVDNAETNFNSSSVGTYSQLTINDADTSTSGLRIGYMYNAGVDEAGRIQAWSSTVGAKLLLNPNGGNVGIGTGSPTAALDVARTSADANIMAETTTSGNAVLSLLNNGNALTTLTQNRSTNNLELASGSSGAFAVSTSGVERMRILGSGSGATAGFVGIGTTNPSTKLDVNGSILSETGSISSNNLLLQGDGTNGYVRTTNASSNLYLGSSNVNRAVINTAGDFSILTGNSLYLTGASTGDQIIRIGSGRSGDGYSYLDLQSDASQPNGMRIIRTPGVNGTNSIESLGTGQLQLVAENAAPVGFYTNAAGGGGRRMVIDPTGNVNIGGDVNAGNDLRYFDIYNTNTGGSAGAIQRFITSNAAGTGSAAADIIKYKFGAFIINNDETDSAAYMGFGLGGLERMRIISSGFVGIGTATPGARLEVDSTDNSAFGVGAAFLTPTISSGNRTLLFLGKAQASSQSAWIDYGYNSTAANTYLGFGHYGVTEQMVLMQTGNLGVGNGNPGTRLVVSGASTVSNPIALGASGAGDTAVFTNSDASYGLAVAVDSNTGASYLQSQRFNTATAFDLDLQPAGGNVGIGLHSFVGSKLTVAGPSVSSFTGTTAGNTLHMDVNSTINNWTADDFTSFTQGSPLARIAMQYTGGGTYLGFGTSNNYSLGITNQAMTIDPSGNVGIGNSNPQGKLTVNGSLDQYGGFAYLGQYNTQTRPAVSGGASGGPPGLAVSWNYSAASGEVDLWNDYAGGSGVNQAFSFKQLNSSSAHTDLLTILQNGNVGIGTVAPGYTLDVSGSMNSSTLYAHGITTIGNGGTGSCGASGFGVANGLIIGCSPSDARLKTKVADLSGEETLSKLSELSTIEYHWNDTALAAYPHMGFDETTNQLGFLAQNVQTVFPEVVSQQENGYYQVDYGRMTVALVSGVNQLNANLESIATTSDFQTGSFAARFWTGLTSHLITWFADTTNGIGDVFAKKINTGELCVSAADGSSTCITKAQLDQLLAGAGASGADNSGAGNAGGNSGDSGNGSGTTPPPDNQNGQDGAPTVTLSGSAAMELANGASFNDPGATATDAEDGDLTSSISVSGSVDTSTAGSYTLTYSVIDSNGHFAEVSRMVVIDAPAAPGSGDESASSGDGGGDQTPVSAPSDDGSGGDSGEAAP